MGKLMVSVVLILLIAVSATIAIRSDCPPSSKVTSCSPKCTEDNQCSSIGGICCSNICNYSSCVIPRGSNTGNSAGYKGSGGSSAYCGNVKCNAQEKCDFDKSTKRQKCVRT